MAAASQGAGRTRPARVRWDRVGRVAMLFALVVLLYLAISPIRSLMSDMHTLSARRAQLHALQSIHRSLVGTQQALARTATSDAEARNLGLVRPGEHEFFVRGLPNN